MNFTEFDFMIVKSCSFNIRNWFGYLKNNLPNYKGNFSAGWDLFEF